LNKPYRKPFKSDRDVAHTHVTLHAKEKSSLLYFWKHWFEREREDWVKSAASKNSYTFRNTA